MLGLATIRQYCESNVSDRKLRLVAIAYARTRNDTGYWVGCWGNSCELYDYAYNLADGNAENPKPEVCIHCENIIHDSAEHVFNVITENADPKLLSDIFYEIVYLPKMYLRIPISKYTLGLAKEIYNNPDGDNTLHRILADSLEEDGIKSSTILHHLRNPSKQHHRGCWVIDKILGKE